MALTLGLVTDLHFGPDTWFRGRLRKLCHRAPALTQAVVRAMDDTHRPDLLVNLGDDLEDEGPAQDRARYAACQALLRQCRAPVVNVAGNHDLIHLGPEDLNALWGREGPLYHSFDHGGFHLVVLHTVERKDRDVRLPAEQLAWLQEDLRGTALPVVVLMHHPADEQDLSDSRWFSGVEHLALVQERRALRALLSGCGRVRVVLNGHVHRNHLSVHGGVPYVTLQSLVENLDEDAPGRVSGAFATVTLDARTTVVRVHGEDPARYQFEP
jgi:3',5'-cyclic AMP phosphodiesterase CpdA